MAIEICKIAPKGQGQSTLDIESRPYFTCGYSEGRHKPPFVVKLGCVPEMVLA
jgi:hypothetical protein